MRLRRRALDVVESGLEGSVSADTEIDAHGLVPIIEQPVTLRRRIESVAADNGALGRLDRQPVSGSRPIFLWPTQLLLYSTALLSSWRCSAWRRATAAVSMCPTGDFCM